MRSVTRGVVGGLAVLAAMGGLAGAARAEGLEISHAWALPAKEGANTNLYLSIANSGEADTLLRVRCPASQFTEKTTVDLGEGAPSTREIKTIPIAASGTTTLAPGGFAIRLLQTTQAVEEGQKIACTLTFQKAGPKEVEAVVTPAGTKAAP